MSTSGAARGLPQDPVVLPATGAVLLGSEVAGDVVDRWRVKADGTVEWGPGGASALDTRLTRQGVGLARLFKPGTGRTQVDFGDMTSGDDGGVRTFSQGSLAGELGGAATGLRLGMVGWGVFVKEGVNATMGIATLVAGTVVVATTKVTATSRIFLSVESPGGTIGIVAVSARTPGTSFTITSSNALDTSQVAWLIVEPA